MAHDLEIAVAQKLIDIPTRPGKEIIDAKHFAALIEQNGARDASLGNLRHQ